MMMTKNLRRMTKRSWMMRKRMSLNLKKMS
jgi:hypothetical protein